MPGRDAAAAQGKGLRVAIALEWVLFALATLSVLLIFGDKSAVSRSDQREPLVLSAALLLGVSLVSFWATKRRQRLDGYILAQLLVTQAVWTVFAYLSGGAPSGATSLYGLTTLAGGYLLAVPGVIVAALSGFVFYALMVALLESGAIAVPSEEHLASYLLGIEESSYFLVANFLVLLLVALLASYLVERLQTTGGKLLAAETRAEEAEQLALLGRLAAGLAHEIRNPLSSIAASVQLLRSGVSGEDRELCEIVLREAGRLDDLVTDMTNLSRPRTPAKERCNVSAVVHDVAVLAAKSGRSSTDVTVRELGTEEPLFVFADPAHLRQLVWNLVRNAVQASNPGGEVRVRLVQGPSGCVLRVEDDGAGISPTARTKLFDAFYTTRSQGTGMGLAVVKKIADEHGFLVEVHSETGQGATFEVVFGSPSPSEPREA